MANTNLPDPLGRRGLFIWALLLGLTAGAGAQSPWTRAKGELYTQIAFHTIPTYDALFGDQLLEREISESTLQLYGEYGVGERSTLTVSIPYRFLANGDLLLNFATPETELGNLNGFGNLSIAFKQRFDNGPVVFSGNLRIDLPTAAVNEAKGLRAGYDATTIMPSVSAGVGRESFYGFAYAGYGLRTNDYSDVLNAGIELGFKAGPVWVTGFSELLNPMRNGDVTEPLPNRLTGLYLNDQGWLSIGLKGIWKIRPKFGVFVYGAGAAWGDRVPASPGLGAGVFATLP